MGIKVLVPTGIGDIAWVYSKLSCFDDMEFHICHDATQRAKTFVEMFPKVSKVVYTDIQYNDMLNLRMPLSSTEFPLFEDKIIPMQANKWLEDGMRIEQFLPELKTDYYFDMKLIQSDSIKADQVLANIEYPIGIATAHAKIAEIWKAWGPDDWFYFINTVRQHNPKATFIMIGATKDMDASAPVMKKLKAAGIPYVDLIGKTDGSFAIEIIKRLKFFVAFASGLAIMSVRCKTPVLMLYPNSLRKMLYAWNPPGTVENGMYIPALWDKPDNIFGLIRSVEAKVKESDGLLSSK